MQTPSTAPCVNPYAMVYSIIGNRDCQSNPIGATIPDPDAGEPGWYITAEPFVILEETPQVADGRLAYGEGGTVTIDYNLVCRKQYTIPPPFPRLSALAPL